MTLTAREADSGLYGVCVPPDVTQPFSYCLKYLSRKPPVDANVSFGLDMYSDTSYLSESPCEALYGGQQFTHGLAAVLESPHIATEVNDSRINHLDQMVNVLHYFSPTRDKFSANSIQPYLEPDVSLNHTVVKIACNPAALLVSGIQCV
jgi:hypothetical protein